jgi:DnaD and phage-associated domain
MKYQNFNAISFPYLLLDFYKDLNVSENELAVILMIDHLLSQGNNFITNELLSLKMNLNSKTIDACMTNLYKKNYIEFIMDGEGKDTRTSIEPLKHILYKKFEESLFSEEEINENKELNEKRDYIFKLFTQGFGRELSPIELSHINQWIKEGINTDIIMNSLKDAISRKKVTISYIDSLIIEKNHHE